MDTTGLPLGIVKAPSLHKIESNLFSKVAPRRDLNPRPRVVENLQSRRLLAVKLSQSLRALACFIRFTQQVYLSAI